MRVLIRVLAGVLTGVVTGLGANYICSITGSACPLMSDRVTAVLIWGLIGGMVSSMFLQGK